MAAIFDAINEIYDRANPAAAEAPPPADSLGDTFGQGVRSGGLDLKGQVERLGAAGLGAAGLGGGGLRAQSVADQAAAARAGANLPSWGDVHDLSSGARWAAGSVGRMAPTAAAVLGAGVASGGGAIPGMLAGTAAMAPGEIGAQIQRADADPASAGLSEGQKLRTAVPVGLGRAALQAVVPEGAAARLTGRAVEGTLAHAGLRAAADIPAQGVAGAATEALSQYGDNQTNPSAGYDTGKILQAGKEGMAVGGLFGAAGLAGHLLHGAVGSAADMAKGVAPGEAEKTPTAPISGAPNASGTPETPAPGAPDASEAPDLADKVGAWAKQNIATRVSDVKSWATDMLGDPATPDSIKGRLQDVLQNPGNAANQTWLAGLKMASEAKDTLVDAAKDPAGALNNLYDAAKKNGSDLLNRMASGAELSDPEAPDPKKAQDDADAMSAKAAGQWGVELSKDNLGPEEASTLRQAMANIGDRASQATIATMMKAKRAAAEVADSIDRFHTNIRKMTDTGTGDVDAEPVNPKIARSDDFSGIDAKIAATVVQTLGADHPAIQAKNASGQMQLHKLAAGLRGLVSSMAAKHIDPGLRLEQINALTDVVGDKAPALVDAVHEAMGGPSRENAAYADNMKQVEAINSGRQGLLETLHKNSADPDLVNPGELQREADMLGAWARNRQRTPEGDAAVKAALQKRYGAKADVVMKAAEATTKHEENILDTADTTEQRSEDGQSRTHYYNQNGQLYESPETVDRSGKYAPAVDQAMIRAQKENPGASVRFRGAREILEDETDDKGHKMVAAKHADLVDEALTHGLDHESAQYEADKRIGDFGHIVAERHVNELALLPGEIDQMKLDTHRYPKSPARLDLGKGMIVDATRIAEVMADKLKVKPTGKAQIAQLFKEGIAALQDRVGHSFDIPNDLKIGRGENGMTWGDAKAMNARTERDKANDADTQTLVKLRQDYKAALKVRDDLTQRVGETAKERGIIKEQIKKANETLDSLREQAREPADRQELRKALDMDRQDILGLSGDRVGESRAALREDAMEKRKKLQDQLSLDDEAKTMDPKQRAVIEKRLDALNRAVDGRYEEDDLMGSGRTDADPFGPTHETLKGRSDDGGGFLKPGGNNDVGGSRTSEPAKPNSNAEKGRYFEPVRPKNAEAKEAQWDAVSTTRNAQQKLGERPAVMKARIERMARSGDYSSLDTPEKNAAANKVAQQLLDEMKGKVLGPANKTLKAALEKRLAESAERPREVTKEGAPPSPKAVAAKKAAFIEKARSGDDGLIKTLKESTDSKGLQRAAEALIGEKASPGIDKTLDAVNARLDELVQQPGEAYGMQTKRYSLMSTGIHNDLGRPGFAATHDSPIKHEGKFDWRAHALKGEGQMVKGAGTYLSTADGVHKYYKAMFEHKVKSDAYQKSWTHEQKLYQTNADKLVKEQATLTHYQKELDRLQASKEMGTQPGAHVAAATREEWENIPRMESSVTDLKQNIKMFSDWLAANEASRPPEVRSPTYHLSVDIKPHELMDWDSSLNKQSKEVQAVATKAMRKFELDPTASAYDMEPNLMQTGQGFYRALSEALGGDREASEYLQENGILGHSMKSSTADGSAHPNYVIYDDSRIHTNYVHFDQTRTDPNATGPINKEPVLDYLQRTHGDSVAAAWADMLHAGEFERTATGDVIRLSVHALDPMSTAYHESLHAFMAKLYDAKQGDIAKVLEKAAGMPFVTNQLKELLKNEPDALKQLRSAEERAAYMYQFWAQGKLKLAPEVEGVFKRIAKFIRHITGMWTNDEHAEHILNYFHSGEYEKTRSDRNAVARALMETDAKRAIDKVKSMTEPFREMAAAVASAGGTRLRDTGISALIDLADIMKRKSISEGSDPGFLPAARTERTRRMNAIAEDMKGYSQAHLDDALHALQNGIKASTPEGRLAARMITKHLDSTFAYMKNAGVNIDYISDPTGAKTPYFPRTWDAGTISSNQDAFLKMLDKYKQSGDFKGDPVKFMQHLMVSDGSEFRINDSGLNKPGMQFAKQRTMDFISHADAAPFMRKDLPNILNSYISQATRRAEWARRLGDNNEGLERMMKAAARQGATPVQIDMARKFVSGVDGTLGDNINPTARRMIGNMIVYQNLRLLPLAIFSSAVDAQGILINGGSLHDTFKTFMRGMRETVKNFQSDPKDDKMTQLAQAIGTVDNAHLIHTLGASYSQGMVGNTGRMINDKLFRFNLMEQYNSSMRVGATEAAMNFLIKHAERPNAHSARFLRELGIDAKDIQKNADGSLKVMPSDGLSMEHSARVKAALNRWVDGAILRPDAVDKPIWMNDPHYALIAHLKQFVYAFHETILKKTVHEAKNGNYAPAMALASYVPMMIAADAVKGLIQGGGQQPDWKKEWGPADYAWSGIERAGLLGTGQFAFDALTDATRGGDGVGSLAGPTIEQLTDALHVMGGRERFGKFATDSMPANALYASALKQPSSDPQFSD